MGKSVCTSVAVRGEAVSGASGIAVKLLGENTSCVSKNRHAEAGLSREGLSEESRRVY
jgi:hypothetical protein